MSYDKIPPELKALKNWVCFRYEKRGKSGKLSKVPVSPLTGKLAKSNDPATWASFEAALSSVGKYNGIGFQFEGSPFVGIDIDHCIESGQMSELAAEIVKLLDSYTEYSPSGTGLHIICRGTLIQSKGANRCAAIGLEIYKTGRYFTMTGNALPGRDKIEERTEAIAEVQRKYIIAPREARQRLNEPPAQPPARVHGETSTEGEAEKAASRELSGVESIVEAARKSKQGAAFEALYSGQWQGSYQSQSEADIALCNMLAFWTRKDAGLMDEIFRLSGLMRAKWDERHGADTYGNLTIKEAVAKCKSVYDSQFKSKQKAKKLAAQVQKTEEELKSLVFLPCTDAGNAERVVFLYGEQIRYCAQYKKWFLYNGKKWVEDDASNLYLMAVKTMRLAGTMVTLAYPEDDDESKKQRESLERFFRGSENMPKVQNMIRYASALASVDAADFDKDIWLLNCQNGVLDLRTGKLLPHDKSYLLSRICNTEYKPQNQAPLWEATIREIIPDDELRQYLQKFMGYILTGSVMEEKLLVLYGQGGGGKGTFIETIGRVLGEYADTIPVDVLLSSRNDSTTGNEPTPELAKLPGVRMALSSESGKGRKFNDAKIKLITGGDMITARRLRCDPFTYKPSYKIILSSNYLPSVADVTDKGVKRRLVIVPFTANLEKKRDVTLKEKLGRPENMAAVLAWCVEGCKMWQQEGPGNLDKLPRAIMKLHGDFYADNDLIGMFIEEECVVGDVHRVKVKTLCQEFNRWMDDGSNFRKMGLKGFTDAMKARGFQKHRFETGFHFMGVDLKWGLTNREQ